MGVHKHISADGRVPASGRAGGVGKRHESVRPGAYVPHATTGHPELSSLMQRAQVFPVALSLRDVHSLQRTIGNQAVNRLLAGTTNRSSSAIAPVDGGRNGPKPAAPALVVQRVPTYTTWATGAQKNSTNPEDIKAYIREYANNVLHSTYAKVVKRIPNAKEKEAFQDLWKRALASHKDGKYADAIKDLNDLAAQVTAREALSFEDLAASAPQDVMSNILRFLTLAEQAKLARSGKTLNYSVDAHQREMPILPGTNIKIAEVSDAMQGYDFVGLHATSSKNSEGLYKGIRPIPKEEQVSDFNQLSSGFYITQGTSKENRQTAETFGKESVIKKGGTVATHRVFVKDFESLEGREVPKEDWIMSEKEANIKAKQYEELDKQYDYLMSEIVKFKGATQIKINPSLIARMANNAGIRVLPPMDEHGNMDPEQLRLWLQSIFPERFRAKK